MFISLEGIDGSGKTTQAKKLARLLTRKYKREVLLTREPGGWKGGSILRRMVRDGRFKHQWSEAFLFLLDRCEHVAGVIEPALEAGATVICDRYQDSTLAYQVWGRGLPLAVFDALAGMAKFPAPDVTVFFDIPVEIALARASKRSSPDAFEKEGAAFMERIRRGYIALSERDPGRWIKIDCAACGEDDIFGKMTEALAGKGVIRD